MFLSELREIPAPGHLCPATGHLDTGFSWFPCVYKQTQRWFPTFQVATTCFSCSPPDLNLLVINFTFCIHVKQPLPPGDNQLQLLLLLSSSSSSSYPLCRVFILIFLRQTMSLGNTVSQLFCCYYSWCLYRYFQC